MALSDEVIRQRLQLLESYVQHLQGYWVRTREEVRCDMSLTWAIEHGLQLSIQCVTDVCHYLVADLALGVPATSQEAIELLRDAGVFPATFADTLAQMARFRNLLVHIYAQVDIERVYDHLQNHLDDFGQFAQHVLQFLAQDG
jgi:uncharacterized protein YutE (UPF0331/DUF86 family)